VILTIGGREAHIAFKRRWLAQIVNDIAQRLGSRNEKPAAEPFTVSLDPEELAIYRSYLKRKMRELGLKSLKRIVRTREATAEHFLRMVQFHCEGYFGVSFKREGGNTLIAETPPPVNR